ncbi:hypothetical protein DFR48_10747 [Ciceribacter lividus]|uniref:Ig-like domain-containing protein n=1 Tax=Ciceribacter lividus TaxID=1197950 RepID=A0A6I7HLK6_9HYPH|nr:putative Ig domain-containing protein [Ciceribacter lividus]RCW23178.1 hypothetical protein DFR48_10747 [Ciceribacter lividus]
MKSSIAAAVLATSIAGSASTETFKFPTYALKVEFTSPDTSPVDRLKAGQPLTVSVVVSRSTGAVKVVPTSTPDWMTYDPKTREFTGVPVPGQHELAVSVTDAGTGQQTSGVLTMNIESR